MKKKFRISVLGLELILGAVIFGAVMCFVNSYNGYREFQKELEIIDGNVTEQFALTAATYVDGDKIDRKENMMRALNEEIKKYVFNTKTKVERQ